MPASTTWRLVGFEPYGGGDVELSSIALADAAGSVDAGATISCNLAPVSGDLANLRDTDLTSTCRYEAAGSVLVITWVFASAVDIVFFRLGSASSQARFPARVDVQYLDSASGAWMPVDNVGDIPYPGANQLTANLPVRTPYADLMQRFAPRAWYRFGDSSGTVCTDSAPGSMYPASYLLDASVMTGTSLIAGTNTALKVSGTTTAARGVSRATPPANTSAAWSLMCVLLPTAAPPNSSKVGTVFQLSGGASAELNVVDDGGVFRLRLMNSGTALLYVTTASWAYGTRLHVCITYAPGTVRMYVSGALVGTASITFTARTSPLLIGHANFGVADYYPVEGRIDEFAVFARTLTVDEIAQASAAMDIDPSAFSVRRVRSQAIKASTAASTPMASHSTLRTGLQLARDTEFGGVGSLYGTTEVELTENSFVPTKSRVRVFRERDGLLAREIWSDPVTGAWSVDGLDPTQQFVAMAQDSNGNYRPTAADRATPGDAA